MNTTVESFLYTPEELSIDEKEALLYLGCRTQADTQLTDMMRQCRKELIAALSCKVCCLYTDIMYPDEKSIQLGACVTESRALRKNLTGCGSACLFAATIGIGADRLIAKYLKTSPAKSVVTDALASAAIEAVCDRFNQTMEEKYQVKPRFSPGYGDFPLSSQRELLSMLDAARRIGVTATDSLMMVPTKSVTAIIGISSEK